MTEPTDACFHIHSFYSSARDEHPHALLPPGQVRRRQPPAHRRCARNACLIVVAVFCMSALCRPPPTAPITTFFEPTVPHIYLPSSTQPHPPTRSDGPRDVRQVQEGLLRGRGLRPPPPPGQDVRAGGALGSGLLLFGYRVRIHVQSNPLFLNTCLITQAGDAAYGKWKGKNTVKACPKCRHHIEKNGGCVP